MQAPSSAAVDWGLWARGALAVGRYLKDRLREPSTVHRGVMAVGGMLGAWNLTGTERWISFLIGFGNLLGVLIPDAPLTGFNEASPDPRPSLSPAPSFRSGSEGLLPYRDPDDDYGGQRVQQHPLPAPSRADPEPGPITRPGLPGNLAGWGDRG